MDLNWKSCFIIDQHCLIYQIDRSLVSRLNLTNLICKDFESLFCKLRKMYQPLPVSIRHKGKILMMYDVSMLYSKEETLA